MVPAAPSHFHVDLTLQWIERIKPKRAILTNMHSDLDYEELRARLPPHVEPAYDGMRWRSRANPRLLSWQRQCSIICLMRIECCSHQKSGFGIWVAS